MNGLRLPLLICKRQDNPTAARRMASRVREAVETGASILAVACPNCAKMLEDAAKAENLEGKINVKEISEIIGEKA